MNIEILDSEKDYSKWEKIINLMPKKFHDIYYSPNYVSMHKILPNSKALLFIYKEKDNIWINPFILQPIEKKIYPHNEQYYDIETAYGYGGPLSNSESIEFLLLAQKNYEEWCKNKNIIAEFIRFHPLFNNQKFYSKNTKIIFNRKTVSLNLKKFNINNPPFDTKVRNMIKKVDKQNIKISIIKSKKFYNDFVQIYINKMKKISADKYYYFNKNYFENLLKLISKNGWFIGATLNDKLIGGSILLKGQNHFHYHLSATEVNNNFSGVTNALIYKGIQIGINENINFFVLGGGNSSDLNDTLYIFKKKMGNTITDFFIGQKIHNKIIYDIIKNNWKNKYKELIPKFGDRLLCYRYTI